LLRSRRVRRQVVVQREVAEGPVTTDDGMTWMRFK